MIYLEGVPIETTLFPDNTSQVWKIKNLFSKKYVNIEWRFQQESEFIHLAQLKDLLDTLKIKTYLTIKYLPYARQDKEINNHSTFALRTFAKLLNSLSFSQVQILDPHSHVSEELINNCFVLYPHMPLVKTIEETKSELLVYPDEGALMKYCRLYDFNYIYGIKERDQETGHILRHELVGECENKNVLIVDDICDGGATFINLAKELLAKNAKEVNLFVTHGIFSRGLKVLKNAEIKRIFTADGEVSENQNGFIYRRL